MVNFAYLRVSTNHQDVANQKFGILEYCNYQKITAIEMVNFDAYKEAKKSQSNWILC